MAGGSPRAKAPPLGPGFGIETSDPGAVRRAYSMGDWSIPQKALAMNRTAHLTSASTEDLTRRVKASFRRLGLETAEEQLPSFDAHRTVGKPAAPAYGYLVGEAGLRINAEMTSRMRRRAAAVAAIGGIGIAVGALVYLERIPNDFVVMPGVVVLAIGLFWTTMSGPWFDSQVVSVQYWGRPPADGTAAVASTAMDFDLTIHAGRIRTINRAGGKGTPPARQFAGVPSGSPDEMAGLPAAVISDIGAVPTSTDGPSARPSTG